MSSGVNTQAGGTSDHSLVWRERGSETGRQTGTETERHRETESCKETDNGHSADYRKGSLALAADATTRLRVTQRDAERRREAQRDAERHRETQRARWSRTVCATEHWS